MIMQDGAPLLAEIEEEAARFENAAPAGILDWALSRFEPAICLACSFGAEDMVLVDMVSALRPGTDVFYLDTSLFFDETYALAARTSERYPIHLIRVAPDLSLEEQAERFGEALWSRQPDLCCSLRKVEPLRRFLQPYAAWITGIRREQAPSRATARPVEWDRKLALVKVNPLVRWTREDVWAYLREHDVPFNPLHLRGYPSIGCRPCTEPVRPGEPDRAGRWRNFNKTECGLHGR